MGGEPLPAGPGGSVPFPDPLPRLGDFAIASHPALMLSLSGIVGLFMGDLLLFQSFVWMGPRLTMLVYTVSPALTAVLAWFFLGETIGGWAWWGWWSRWPG